MHSGGKYLKTQEDGEKEAECDESREKYKQLWERERVRCYGPWCKLV